jgi:hypothetical protein
VDDDYPAPAAKYQATGISTPGATLSSCTTSLRLIMPLFDCQHTSHYLSRCARKPLNTCTFPSAPELQIVEPPVAIHFVVLFKSLYFSGYEAV